MGCHTLDKAHVQDDNTAQLNCSEGAVKQTADVVESYLGCATQDNGATCPTKLPVPGPHGGREQTKYNSGRNDAAIRHTGDEAADGRRPGMVRIIPTHILVEREKWCP